jgi:HSP20 family protein
LVNSFFGSDVNEVSGNQAFFRPSMDLVEKADAYELTASIPGLQKEDVSIELKKGELLISGERTNTRTENGDKVHLSEIVYGKFSRRFYLPENVDAQAIDAKFENGLLHISIPKSEEVKPKKIEIK